MCKVNALWLSQVLNEKVSKVEIKRLCSLWAGYGSIQALCGTIGSNSISLMCKLVNPPKGESGVAHQRKVDSYVIEVKFYNKLSVVLNEAGIRVAKVFHTESDDNGNVVLLMSDLRSEFSFVGDQLSLKSGTLDAAIDWLAKFHAYNWQQCHLWKGTAGKTCLWPEGSYWRLDTRKDEFENIGVEWKRLKNAASIIAILLRDGTHRSDCNLHRTVIHGDFKSPNMLFSQSCHGSYVCAAVDFQYCGGSYGVRDVVKLVVSSMDMPSRMTPAQFAEAEQTVLRLYHSRLLSYIPQYHPELALSGADSCARASPPLSHCIYPFQQMMQHYELCLIDYVRFMAGWGFWGNYAYAKTRTLHILDAIDGGECLTVEQYTDAFLSRYSTG
jgi:hypothetical protein